MPDRVWYKWAMCDLQWHFSCSSMLYYCRLINGAKITLPFHSPIPESLPPAIPGELHTDLALASCRVIASYIHRYTRQLLQIVFTFHKCHSGVCCSYPDQIGPWCCAELSFPFSLEQSGLGIAVFFNLFSGDDAKNNWSQLQERSHGTGEKKISRPQELPILSYFLAIPSNSKQAGKLKVPGLWSPRLSDCGNILWSRSDLQMLNCSNTWAPGTQPHCLSTYWKEAQAGSLHLQALS
jgi:hypothetical protein